MKLGNGAVRKYPEYFSLLNIRIPSVHVGVIMMEPDMTQPPDKTIGPQQVEQVNEVIVPPLAGENGPMYRVMDDISEYDHYHQAHTEITGIIYELIIAAEDHGSYPEAEIDYREKDSLEFDLPFTFWFEISNDFSYIRPQHMKYLFIGPFREMGSPGS
jgi:hypothetical protein